MSATYLVSGQIYKQSYVLNPIDINLLPFGVLVIPANVITSDVFILGFVFRPDFGFNNYLELSLIEFGGGGKKLGSIVESAAGVAQGLDNMYFGNLFTQNTGPGYIDTFGDSGFYLQTPVIPDAQGGGAKFTMFYLYI